MIYIVTIPGIGTFDETYTEKFIKDIDKFSKKTKLENNYKIISLLPCRDTNIDKNQADLMSRINKVYNYGVLHKFALEFFGDAVSFERNENNPNSTYNLIHTYLKTQFEKVHYLMKNDPQAKLVIVATSMGVQMLSTYIWDADNNKGIFSKTHANSSNNLRNLELLASVGCNIPLFVSALPESKIIAFNKRNPQFIWDNYFDKNDILGWPLKQLSSSYNALVNDYKINSGITALDSHLGYWGDNDFTKPFVKRLISLL